MGPSINNPVMIIKNNNYYLNFSFFGTRTNLVIDTGDLQKVVREFTVFNIRKSKQ